MGTCSEEEEVDGALDEDEGNLIYKRRKNVKIFIRQTWTINILINDYFSADVEINTMRYIDHESDNNGLVSENLIRLTPEEEDSGVFRYVSITVK